jgi:phospholipid/cholesterol/gamma-HCH transport system permease protein
VSDASGGDAPRTSAASAANPADEVAGRITNVFASTGRFALDALALLGAFGILLRNLVAVLPQLPRTVHLTFTQMMAMGVHSLPLVLITAAFTGAVTAVQAAYQFQGWVSLVFLGTVVCRSVVIELGPVLTALVVGGRVGASAAAELGTMRVTEQIDAMEAIAIDPNRYLVLPRVVALTIMLPVLTIFADVIAILGAYVVAYFTLDLTTHTYTTGLRLFFKVHDVMGGLIKAAVFGFTIALMGCFFGLRTEGGAEGVGVSTTRAVVASCLLILIMDYFLASVLFQFLFTEL